MAAEQEFWSRHLTASEDARERNVVIESANPSYGFAHSSRSLAQQMPYDILRHIFLDTREFMTFPFAPSRKSETISHAHRKITTVAQVCRQWRITLLSTPVMWTTISVYKPKLSTVPLVELWLIRGQSSLPLVLELWSVRKEQVAVADRIMDLFIRQVHRWKEIAFSIRHHPHPGFLNIHPGSLTVLESAFLDIPNWPEELQVCAWEIIGSSPVLHDIRMDYPFLQPLPPLQWNNLVSVYISDLPHDSFFRVLGSCTHLKRLEYLPNPDAEPEFESIVVVQTLRWLAVTSSESWIYRLFDFIACPALEKLDLGSIGAPNDFHIQSLVGFLSRSGCRIQDVSLTIWDLCGDLRPIFSSPALAHLRRATIQVPAMDDFIRAMTLDEQTGNGICPILEDLELRQLGSTSSGLLPSMLRSRKGTLGKAKISVGGDPEELEEGHRTAEELRQSGMEISLEMLNPLPAWMYQS